MELIKKQKYFSEDISEFLFPKKCVSCGKPIGQRGRIALCESCNRRFLSEKDAPCIFCGNPADSCRCKIAFSTGLDSCFCVTPYSKHQDTVSKRLILAAKSARMWYLFGFMANQITDLYRFSSLAGSMTAENCVVTYIPRNPKTVRKRGFDQAREIALRIAKMYGIPCVTALKHTESDVTQKQLSLDERYINARTSYLPGKSISIVKNKNVILADDLLTTGATVSVCATILRENGAASVHAVAFARNTEIILPGIRNDIKSESAGGSPNGQT